MFQPIGSGTNVLEKIGLKFFQTTDIWTVA